MTRSAYLLTTIVLLFLSIHLFANDRKPKAEKQPSWVVPAAVSYNDHSLDEEAENGYVDLHFEKQVSLAQRSVFVKKAMRVLSETGAQSLSEVSVEYQPSYQEVLFHTVRIIRGNQIINQLHLSRIKTIQQENELDRSIYNGSLTAMLILEDLRKDDVIEYSYTIQGFNPVFQNKYTGSFITKFSVPVYQIYYRLIVPHGRQLHIQNTLTDLQPKTVSNSEGTIYEWTSAKEKPLALESNLPAWYDVIPAVMFSEFSSWKQVADWALALYPFNQPSSGGLKQKTEEIKAKFSSVEDKVLAALRFVQDEVRYMGIEMGENSHRPHTPSQVFQQRFGDCKDKAYLLCTMLKAMDVEAYPVLINTDYKKTIADWPPSPTSFNHITVMATIAGKNYWFDPTISYQRGKLKDISFPDYQVGLVIKPGTTGLTPIPLQNNGRVKTKEIFYVEDLEKPIRFVVTTNFTGSFADNVRYDFKSNSKKEMLSTYQNLYASYFKKIDADSISVTDNEETGEFITREYYTIEDFWKIEKGMSKVLLEPYLINSVVNTPENGNRRMPFNIRYPARYTEEIEIHLPEDWPIEESAYSYSLPGCKLSYAYSQTEPNVVLLHFTYESNADHISPADISNYSEQIEEASKSLAFELSYGATVLPASTTLNTSTDKLFTILYVVLGFLLWEHTSINETSGATANGTDF